MRSDNLASKRIGIVGNNTYGSKMEIVEYNKARDIMVRFIDHNNTVHATWGQFCKGEIRNVYDKSVYGVGYIGEGEYKSKINGKRTPQYATWRSMIARCYDEKYHEKQPTYIHCSVSPEWHNFQNFAKWYDENYYEVDNQRMELDKDILIKGNKVYSSENCVFVPKNINGLFIKCNASRGDLPIGVHFHKENNKFIARCMNGTGGNRIHLGSFTSPEEAFFAYKSYKEKLIKQIAEEHKNQIPEKLYQAMIKYRVEIDD